MKILGISGGSKGGANDNMCRTALKAAKAEGAEIEFVRLMDLNIKHCTGCKVCVMSLFSGKGNRCVLKDDFDWLLDKMMDANGILFSIPIFEKCAAGIFHTIMDRFGPRMARSNNIVADKIARTSRHGEIDPRYLQDRVISYMAIGGSDWTTQVQCDFALHALTPMWKIIDNEAFQWSLGIMADKEKVSRAELIGRNLAVAAGDIAAAEYQGEAGICSHCHSRNFFIEGKNKVICGICGIVGKLVEEHEEVKFIFSEEQLEYAHDTMSGQFVHADDIQANEKKAGAFARSDEYRELVKQFAKEIPAVKPI